MTSASEGASNKDLVDGYVAAVRRGDEWPFTGPDITFPARGVLLDGVHDLSRPADARIVELPRKLERQLWGRWPWARRLWARAARRWRDRAAEEQAVPVVVDLKPKPAPAVAPVTTPPTGAAWLAICEGTGVWELTVQHLAAEPLFEPVLWRREVAGDEHGIRLVLAEPVNLIRISGPVWPGLWERWAEAGITVVHVVELVMAGASVYSLRSANPEEG